VLTVNAANVPPHLTAIGNKVALVGQPLQFTIQAGDGDQESLIFSAVGLPGNASLTPGQAYGQAVVSWTPTTADVGNYTVLARVTDSGNGDPAQPLSDQQTFSLVVRTSNQAPVWVSSADQTAPAGQTLAIQLRAGGGDRWRQRSLDLFGGQSTGRRDTRSARRHADLDPATAAGGQVRQDRVDGQ